MSKLNSSVQIRSENEVIPSAMNTRGGGVSESTDRRGCAILAFEVVPKNLIFA